MKILALFLSITFAGGSMPVSAQGSDSAAFMTFLSEGSPLVGTLGDDLTSENVTILTDYLDAHPPRPCYTLAWLDLYNAAALTTLVIDTLGSDDGVAFANITDTLAERFSADIDSASGDCQ